MEGFPQRPYLNDGLRLFVYWCFHFYLLSKSLIFQISFRTLPYGIERIHFYNYILDLKPLSRYTAFKCKTCNIHINLFIYVLYVFIIKILFTFVNTFEKYSSMPFVLR